MKWFLNLSTRAKLLLGFAAILLCMIIVVGVAYSAIKQIQKTDKGLFENEFVLVQKLLELRADLNHQRADIQQMMLETNRSDQETIEKDLIALAGQADGIIQDLFEMLRDDRNLLQRLQDLEAIRKEYKQARDAQIREAILVARVKFAAGPAETLTADVNHPLPTNLWLGELPGEKKTRPTLAGMLAQDTFVRVLLPVRPKE